MKLLSILLLVLVASLALAQKPSTPKAGSAERKAIVDALRVPVQKDFKGQKVQFRIESLRVLNGWAFLNAYPMAPGGKALKTKGTRFEEQDREGMYDGGVFALLRKEKGKWKVKRYVIGATDVPWIGWDKEFNAPSAIFPN